MKQIIVAMLAGLLLVGCSNEYSSGPKRASISNGKNPELILKETPKGALYRITIDRGAAHATHYVYFFDQKSNTTVTLNHSERSGKTHYNNVVVVDGVEYVPKVER